MGECTPAPSQQMQQVLELLGGKWKILILWHLSQSPHLRFSALKACIPKLSQRVLTLQLRELEASGLVTRRAYAEVPPRVEYAITDKALDLRPMFTAILVWREKYPE